MDGSPARSNVPNHQLHIAGEEGGSATMVAVFCRFFCVVAGCGISSSSSYVAFGTKKTKGGAGAVLLSVPHWRAPHHMSQTLPTINEKSDDVRSVSGYRWIIFLDDPL